MSDRHVVVGDGEIDLGGFSGERVAKGRLDALDL